MREYLWLYIDDDEDDAEILSGFVRRSFPNVSIDHRTVPPKDLAEYDRYDVVLFDYFMGVQNPTGVDLARQLREAGRDVPIVILSGHDIALAQCNDVWHYADYVVSKNHVGRSWGRLNALVRWLHRLDQVRGRV